MKKIFAMLAITAIGFGANAQTAKGNWMVGGSASFQSISSSGGGNSTSVVTLAPGAMYFFADNFAAGAAVSLTSASSGGSSATDFLAGPGARYYFAELSKTAKLFGGATVLFGSTSSGGVSISKSGWGLSAGAAFFLNKNVALEGSLAYASTKVSGASVSANTFGVGFGFQIHL